MSIILGWLIFAAVLITLWTTIAGGIVLYKIVEAVVVLSRDGFKALWRDSVEGIESLGKRLGLKADWNKPISLKGLAKR